MSESSNEDRSAASVEAQRKSAPPLRVACLVSGAGSTVMNLADRVERGELPVEIALVAATKPGVAGIDLARQRAMPVAVIERSDGVGAPAGNDASTTTSGNHGRSLDDRLDDALLAARADLICLCGYLRLFRVGRWAGRVINIHPGPLPRFGGRGMYGLRVHRAVLDAGLAETSCCVHLVDEIYDHGQVLAERRVPIVPGDTPESLDQRVRHAERELLPEVLRRIATGEIPLPIRASMQPSAPQVRLS